MPKSKSEQKEAEGLSQHRQMQRAKEMKRKQRRKICTSFSARQREKIIMRSKFKTFHEVVGNVRKIFNIHWKT